MFLAPCSALLYHFPFSLFLFPLAMVFVEKRFCTFIVSFFFRFFDRKIYNAYKRRIVCSCSVAWIRPLVVMQAVRPCFVLASHLHINAKLPLKYLEVNCLTFGSSHSVQHFNHSYGGVNSLMRFGSSFLFRLEMYWIYCACILE